VIDYSDPDPSKHYAYFGTTSNPGTIIKVRLNAGDTAPTFIARSRSTPAIAKERSSVA